MTPLNHKEAFCLMNYQCESCGHREVIWNSRDGVTPFYLLCPKCRELNHKHVDIHLDRMAPDHIPHSGQRVFIDLPESLKPVLARRRVEHAIGAGKKLSYSERRNLEAAIIADFQPGTPWLITFP